MLDACSQGCLLPRQQPGGLAMRIFRRRRPKRLVSITHVTAQPDQKELVIRFVFDERPALDATVSFDAVERMARLFSHLASVVDQPQGNRSPGEKGSA
jgi:hypothetical protein